MLIRLLSVLIAVYVFAPLLAEAQDNDAQDRTQQFFDDHKGADVLNPTRALTDKVRPTQHESLKSTLPPLTGVPDAPPKRVQETKEIVRLRQGRKNFIREQVSLAEKTQSKQNGPMATPSAAATPISTADMTLRAEKAWQRTKDGRRLSAMVAKSAKNASYLPPLTK